MPIRAATAAELPRLQEIERVAGEPFRALGMAAVADDEPPSLDLLEEFRAAGRAWVSVDGGNRPLAYLIHEDVDGAAHVEQVSVDPAAAHRRLGSGLIDHLAGRAAAGGLTALTLTTFAEVPWNAPYYTRLGFRVLAEAELTEGLRAIRHTEQEIGLDRWPRVCMRREL
ncbi:GNAT family N-acetyltransferase [Streptomyces clavuligerus]|uniref:Putative acetyltransferase n=2 Tax=Streptomyces clavuligerus TaxID=1901 RepID=B5GRM5_STRCL|nr:GNAT family N-acetyltransferase [Streptomyces clavuligerus]ANW17448.1 GCN5 family acetyltransferase [Streptomyces clavuligerus]AXU11996.1 GNAT family N-acetyltransferase [Streptomyces clavuligerus]EDY48971.1 acetyltransferase [Streptomyces clavuligerus]EFG10061.1 putative acetyltransferase [Streptomyces clavuligerus]MBY6301847.1 GNAT family N-acetyltransferase [Streptomyces clavuligerus]